VSFSGLPNLIVTVIFIFIFIFIFIDEDADGDGDRVCAGRGVAGEGARGDNQGPCYA
jgi:hypothetical protein